MPKGSGASRIAGWGGADDMAKSGGGGGKGEGLSWLSRKVGRLDYFLNKPGVAFLQRWVNDLNDLVDVMLLLNIWWGPTGGGNLKLFWHALLASLESIFDKNDLPLNRFLDRDGALEFCVESESCILQGASREGLLGLLRAFFLQLGPEWRDDRKPLFAMLARLDNLGETRRFSIATTWTHCVFLQC